MLKGMAFSPVRVMRVEEESPYKPEEFIHNKLHFNLSWAELSLPVTACKFPTFPKPKAGMFT